MRLESGRREEIRAWSNGGEPWGGWTRGDELALAWWSAHSDSPRADCDNAAVLCFDERRTNRYKMDDEQMDERALEARRLRTERSGGIAVAITIYEHGGVALRVEGEGTPTGVRCGYALIDAETIAHEWDAEVEALRRHARGTTGAAQETVAKALEMARRCAISEIREYGYYMEGSVYGGRRLKVQRCDMGHLHGVQDTDVDIVEGCVGNDPRSAGLLENLRIAPLGNENGQWQQRSLDDIEAWMEERAR